MNAQQNFAGEQTEIQDDIHPGIARLHADLGQPGDEPVSEETIERRRPDSPLVKWLVGIVAGVGTLVIAALLLKVVNSVDDMRVEAVVSSGKLTRLNEKMDEAAKVQVLQRQLSSAERLRLVGLVEQRIALLEARLDAQGERTDQMEGWFRRHYWPRSRSAIINLDKLATAIENEHPGTNVELVEPKETE